MAEDTGERTGASSRRKFILAGGAVGVAGLAGCTGGDAEEGDGGDGGAGAGLGSSDDGGESDDPLLSDDFDPENPDWENNNYYGGALVEAGYLRGTLDDLEEMGNRGRTEAVHGIDPRERPDDESEWIDPDPLVYAELPREDTESAYEEQLAPMIEKLEAETGKDVEFRSVDSYAAVVESMRSERVHIANFATGNTPFGVNLAGMVPLAAGVDGGQFGYKLWAVTRADHEITSVEDFADEHGYRIAHTEESSNSGNQAPSALFDEYFDLTIGENYNPEFSGGHEQTGRGIAYGDFDAGPICNTCLDNTVEAVDDIEWDDYKVLWSSDPFPPGPVGYRYNLHPDIVEGARETWINTNWEGTSFGDEAGYPEYVEIDYVNHWHEIMLIQQFNGVEYEQGDL